MCVCGCLGGHSNTSTNRLKGETMLMLPGVGQIHWVKKKASDVFEKDGRVCLVSLEGVLLWK